MIKRYGNSVFKRVGKARLPIERLWGPAVPTEMLRDEALAAWQDQHPRVLSEVQRLVGLMLTGAKFGAAPRSRNAA